MSLKNLVLSIEQSKHLQELGLFMSDAALCWTNVFSGDKSSYIVMFSDDFSAEDIDIYDNEESGFIIPTFTLEEVLDKLPNKIYLAWLYIVKYENKLLYAEDYYEDDLNALTCFEGDTLLEAAYKMLCWVVENGYLED